MTAEKKWTLLNVINSKKYCQKSIGIGIGNTFSQSIVTGIDDAFHKYPCQQVT